MRLIDAEGSELKTQLKIIREAEYQIYGSGSWGFTAKCEHAIEDAPTVQSEPHWIPCSERLPAMGKSVLMCDIDGDIYLGHRTQCGYYYPDFYNDRVKNVTAWMPLPEPFKGGGDGMNKDTADISYEQLCKEYEHMIEELNNENEKLKLNVQAMEEHIRLVEKENARLEGRIDGLEFAIRCNGISGEKVT